MKDLSKIKLGEGMHAPDAAEKCVLEAVAWWRGEPHNAHPTCVDDVLAYACKSLNDLDWPADERTSALMPLVIPLSQSNTTRAVSVKRAWFLVDWALRGWLPLLLPKQSTTLRKALESLPEITPETALDAHNVINNLPSNRDVVRVRLTLARMIVATGHGHDDLLLDAACESKRPVMPMVWLAVEQVYQHLMTSHDDMLRDAKRRTRRDTAARVRTEMVGAIQDAIDCF